MDAVITSFFTTVSNMTSQPPIPPSVMQETMAILLNPFAKSKEVLTSFVPPTSVVPAIKSSSSAFLVYEQQKPMHTADGHQEIPAKPIEQSSQLSASFASSSSTTAAPATNNNLSAFKVYQRPDQSIPAVQHSIFKNVQRNVGNSARNAEEVSQTRQGQ
ncbi:hypothetical protein CAEBREN_21647 [Caenorhabditis brenneri]|uniref:Uncharacterized protein n=1 Tax=Caenorhabditis brenneri TaxID=135651 RepID=G0N7V1_CAEBE|nr:hypothetical protein CAEBREN_21647 [Caenorhabditis brenneri]